MRFIPQFLKRSTKEGGREAPTATHAAPEHSSAATGSYQQPQLVPSKRPGPVLEAAIAAAARGRVQAGAIPSAVQPPHMSIEMRLSELRASGYLPPLMEDNKIANEFRVIKRSLLNHLPGRCKNPESSANVIMVSSALSNEGKTTCTLNLAFALSLERDFSVVLVDGDVVNPTISRMLGVEEQPGLLDVLRDPTLSLNDVEIGTGVQGLTLIPAGKRGYDSPELLSSNRMMRLTEEMQRASNRLFLFDSTPILLTNESRALSEMAGQIAFIVRAGSTPRDAVKDAISLLAKDTYVGIVLNFKSNHDDEEYYYYYSYDYESTSDEEA